MQGAAGNPQFCCQRRQLWTFREADWDANLCTCTVSIHQFFLAVFWFHGCSHDRPRNQPHRFSQLNHRSQHCSNTFKSTDSATFRFPHLSVPSSQGLMRVKWNFNHRLSSCEHPSKCVHHEDTTQCGDEENLRFVRRDRLSLHQSLGETSTETNWA